MLVPILFGVVVLAVVIGVWIYRGTKEGKPVDNAVSNPEYDPGKVLVTADENKAVNNNTNMVDSRSQEMNAQAYKNVESSKSRLETDAKGADTFKSESMSNDDTQKLYTSEPVIPGEENKGTVDHGAHYQPNKEESFEGSGVYTASNKKTTGTELNQDSHDDLNYRESDLQEEKTVNNGQNENRKPEDPNMA